MHLFVNIAGYKDNARKFTNIKYKFYDSWRLLLKFEMCATYNDHSF
jgi:hypothetical protein